MSYDPYAAGYRAASYSCWAMMPWFMTEAQQGEWLAGFIEAAADLMNRKPKLERQVAEAMGVVR